MFCELKTLLSKPTVKIFVSNKPQLLLRFINFVLTSKVELKPAEPKARDLRQI